MGKMWFVTHKDQMGAEWAEAFACLDDALEEAAGIEDGCGEEPLKFLGLFEGTEVPVEFKKETVRTILEEEKIVAKVKE